MTGLAIGVSSMKSGERALLHVGWELGYGKEGSFSFPNVPPMADILYEAELIGFDETKEVSCLRPKFVVVYVQDTQNINLNMSPISQGCQQDSFYYYFYFQGKARGDMTVEERIGVADRRKMDGNALFMEEKLEEAMQQYEMVTHFYF